VNNLDWLQELKPEDIQKMTFSQLLRVTHAIIEAYESWLKYCAMHTNEQNRRIGELQAEIEKLRGARPKEYEGC
jgi:hypothetical protein